MLHTSQHLEDTAHHFGPIGLAPQQTLGLSAQYHRAYLPLSVAL